MAGGISFKEFIGGAEQNVLQKEFQISSTNCA